LSELYVQRLSIVYFAVGWALLWAVLVLAESLVGVGLLVLAGLLRSAEPLVLVVVELAGSLVGVELWVLAGLLLVQAGSVSQHHLASDLLSASAHMTGCNQANMGKEYSSCNGRRRRHRPESLHRRCSACGCHLSSYQK